MAVYGFVWLRMAKYGFVGLCRAGYGYVSLCLAMYGYLGLCMTVYGFVSLCRAARQEKSHSPIILPNGEYHENPTLTVRFAILENVQ